MTDLGITSVKSINCDVCTINTDKTSCSSDDCIWMPKNRGSTDTGVCVDKCKARLTKGECEQYTAWNRNKLSDVIYDFDGNDDRCQWYPHPHSVDDTFDSKEGTCRPTKRTQRDASGNITYDDALCFQPDTGSCPSGFTSTTFKEGNYCIPNNNNNLDETTIGEPYCANLYNGHHLGCSQRAPTNPTAPLTESDCGSECQLYQDERIKLLPSSTQEKDRGICVSDGQHNYNQETGAEMGLLMTDVECGQHKTNQECINFNGLGCKWEPFNSFCVPKIDTTSVQNMYNSCKPIQGHVPGDYDVNMLDAEKIKMADYHDRNNKKYPYFTSKYLCDVCHMRDMDLDNMYDMRGLPDQLKYYMIKKRIELLRHFFCVLCFDSNRPNGSIRL